MSTTVYCPKCERTFSSYENYEKHLPCHGHKILGASGGHIKESAVATGEGGDGTNMPEK